MVRHYNIMTPIQLKCQHCFFIWWYTGNSMTRAICPECGSSVTIKKSNPNGFIDRMIEYEKLMKIST